METARVFGYKNLIVYQKAKSLAVDIIRFFSKNKLPRILEFVIIQLFKSVTSIGANIAEGYGRHYRGNLRQFFSISRGSSFESDFWLEILQETDLFEDRAIKGFASRNDELSKMLTTLMKKTDRTQS